MRRPDDLVNLKDSAELFGLPRESFSPLIRRMGYPTTKLAEPGRTLYLTWDQLGEISQKLGIPIEMPVPS